MSAERKGMRATIDVKNQQKVRGRINAEGFSRQQGRERTVGEMSRLARIPGISSRCDAPGPVRLNEAKYLILITRQKYEKAIPYE